MYGKTRRESQYAIYIKRGSDTIGVKHRKHIYALDIWKPFSCILQLCKQQLSNSPENANIHIQGVQKSKPLPGFVNIMIFSKISTYRKYRKYRDIFDILIISKIS